MSLCKITYLYLNKRIDLIDSNSLRALLGQSNYNSRGRPGPDLILEVLSTSMKKIGFNGM